MLGERLGGFIYGTILSLSVLVGAAKAYPHHAWKVVVLLAVTATVFWLAHVYAHSLAHVLSLGKKKTSAGEGVTSGPPGNAYQPPPSITAATAQAIPHLRHFFIGHP